MSSLEPTNIRYDFDDWHEDFSYVLELEKGLLAKGITEYPESLWDYFREKYGETWKFHSDRLIAANRYQKRRLDDFDEPPFAISGEMGTLTAIGKVLIDVLHRFYCQCPDHMIHEDYDPEHVKQVARELDGA